MPILQLLTSFPTAVPTVLLAVLMIYWLMSIIGIVDLGDALHAHHGAHLDGIDAAHGASEAPDLHSLAAYLVALGLGGVPLSLVASVLVFFTWLGTALLHNYVIAYLSLEPVRVLSVCAREQVETQKIQAEEHAKSEMVRLQAEQIVLVQQQNTTREKEVAENNRKRAVAIEEERVTRARQLEIVDRIDPPAHGRRSGRHRTDGPG